MNVSVPFLLNSLVPYGLDFDTRLPAELANSELAWIFLHKILDSVVTTGFIVTDSWDSDKGLWKYEHDRKSDRAVHARRSDGRR